MVNSQKISSLIPLAKQLTRNSHHVVAIRNGQLLRVHHLQQQVVLIYQQLSRSSLNDWAIDMQDSFNFVAGLLALLYAGKQPILLSSMHRELSPYYQAILTDHITNNNHFLADQNIVNINQLTFSNKINQQINLPGNFQSNTLTIFTSGSTGLPKPIIKTLAQLEEESEILTNYFGNLSNQLFIGSVSHEHMYGLTFKIMLALTNQVPFVCEMITYQEQILKYNDKNIIYITTPSIIKNLDSHLEKINCNKVISAGGALNYQTAQLCLKCLNVLPHEIYGSTETGIIASRQQYYSNTPWQLFPHSKLIVHNDQVNLISPLINQQEILNDKIELIDEKRFYLNGRTDKIVKISEKRVSLTYIEQQLNQLAEIEQTTVIALEQTNRTILAAVIILSAVGRQKYQQLGHFQLTQYFRQQLKDKLSLVTIPKKWRFIKELPTNQLGKTTYIELKTLFDRCGTIMKTLPKELNITVSDNIATLELQVPDDLFWFKGHFPTQPLLPGVVQLNWVMYYSNKLFAIKPEVEAIEIVKFQLPILPNDQLLLQINWNNTLNKLQFTYTVANKIASTGKIKIWQ